MCFCTCRMWFICGSSVCDIFQLGSPVFQSSRCTFLSECLVFSHHILETSVIFFYHKCVPSYLHNLFMTFHVRQASLIMCHLYEGACRFPFIVSAVKRLVKNTVWCFVDIKAFTHTLNTGHLFSFIRKHSCKCKDCSGKNSGKSQKNKIIFR